MIFCAGSCEIFEFARPIGIGLVSSAINLTKHIIIDKNIKEIVFIGTCGLYKNGKILNIYESKNATNIEISKILKYSYSPIDDISYVSRETNTVNSSNYITTNKYLAHQLFDIGLFMENMEFYSVAKVAQNFNLPFKGIFCATNFCNEYAHEDFKKNHKKAVEILNSYMKEVI